MLDAGDWVEYRIEIPAPCRLEIEVTVELDDRGRRMPPAVTLDGVALAMRSDGGCLLGTTIGQLGAGRHEIRIEGRCPETIIRAVGARPSTTERA